MPRSFLMSAQPELEQYSVEKPSETIKSFVLEPDEKKGKEMAAKQWMEHFMIAIYAFTIILVLIIKLLMEVCILTYHPNNIPIFEQDFTTFYKCLFFGLTSGYCFIFILSHKTIQTFSDSLAVLASYLWTIKF